VLTPKHIAIIMDGNGRWAQEKGLERLEGHAAGVHSVLRSVQACIDQGVSYLTLYAFSTENWKRSQEEVSGLMLLLGESLMKYLPDFMEKGIRLNVIGDMAALPEEVCEKLNLVREETKSNETIVLTLALNYGSRDEILRATRKLMQSAIDGDLKPEDLSEDLIADALDTFAIPDPELLIRTSGEMRLSNFLLWQVSYSEFISTAQYWPDFDETSIKEAIAIFNTRQRRFGGRL
jgi:undecaprenyl diphosphate synthase